MSKRKNPFSDVAPIQLKVHVSAKHIASREDMEEVYSEMEAYCLLLNNAHPDLFGCRKDERKAFSRTQIKWSEKCHGQVNL